MLTFLEQVISFFNQNPLVALITGGYLLITFGDRKERELYFERTWKILIAPIQISEYTNAPGALKSFEQWLDKLLLTSYVQQALRGLSDYVSGVFKTSWKKTVGWLFLDIMMIAFLIADLITIREIAALLGFPINFSSLGALSFLERFDYGFAITAGTFFSIIAAGFVLFEISTKKGRESEFSNYSSEFYDTLRSVIKYSAIITIISSLLVIIFFGLRAYAVASTLPNEIANDINGLAQFGGNVLVRLNAFIVTLLISTESINGLQSIFIVLILISIVFLSLFYLVTETITIVLRVIFDMVYRAFLWVIWTLSFWIAKPIDKVLFPAKALWHKITGKMKEEENDDEDDDGEKEN